MKYLLFIISFLITADSSYGQTHKADSLKQRVVAASGNKERLNALLDLLQENESMPEDTVWYYAVQAENIALQLNDKISKSRAVLAKQSVYQRWNFNDSAESLINAELTNYKVENPLSRSIYFKLQQAKLDCEDYSDNYEGAIAQTFKIMHEAEKYNDSVVIAETKNSIGAMKYDMDFVDESISWLHDALSYTSFTPRFYEALNSIYLNLGDDYWWIKKTDSAAYYYNKALELSRHTENLFYTSYGLQKAAFLYADNREFSKAEQSALESIGIAKKFEGDVPQQGKIIVLSSIYEKWGKYDKAIRTLTDGIIADSIYAKRRKDSIPDLQRIFYYEELAKCYQLNNDYKNYALILEKIISGKDEFYKSNSASAIADVQTKYEVQKKEATIVSQKLELVKENYLLYGSLLLLLLGSIIAWFVFKDIRRRQQLKLQLEKKAAEKAVAEAEEKERKRIAADLHDNLGAYAASIAANVEQIMRQPHLNDFALNQLKENSYSMVSQLNDTIWVLKKDALHLTEISDRIKIFVQRISLNYPGINMDVAEQIDNDISFSPVHAFHLFQIVQEAVNNAVKHSAAVHVSVSVRSHKHKWSVSIEDDGKGMNAPDTSTGNGLYNMRVRAENCGWDIAWQSNEPNGIVVMIAAKSLLNIPGRIL